MELLQTWFGGCEYSIAVPVKARFSRRSVPLEVLHGALVGFGLLARVEGAQVSSLTCLRVFLAGVEAIFAGRQFSNHADLDDRFFVE